MENILYNISQVLGVTIIHSLWQGMLVYFVLRIVFAASPSMSALKKYYLAIFSIVTISVLFIYTLLSGIHTYNWVDLRPVNFTPLLPSFKLPVAAPLRPSLFDGLAVYMPYICTLYFAGLLVNIFKLGFEWNKIRQIKRSLLPAEQMQQFITSFSKKLNIRKPIQLKFSELVDVPCMIGYFKPLILLPVTIATHLSACEIEAILLHELSHIKRNDYLVNIMQQVIKVVLFFNPFAQLINLSINQERENSCDDLVIEKTRKPLIYARALLKLEETRGAKLQLALAATGKKHYLLNRIERIMKTKQPIGNIRHLAIAIFLLAGSLGSIAWFNPTSAKAETKLNGVNKLVAKPHPATDAVKEQFVVKIDTSNGLLGGDTSKRHHKSRVTVVKNGVKKEYVFDDDSLTSDSMRRLYFGADWRNQMDLIRKQGDELKKQFNSPEWRSQMDAMKKQSDEIKKQFNNPEWKAQMLAMQKQNDELKKQFNSQAWKTQMELIKKQGDVMRKQFDNPEWKKQMELMNKQSEDMRKQFDNQAWKTQMELIKKQGDVMRKQFDNPEWKKQMEVFQKQNEDIRKQFDSPQWKKQMEDMKKQGEDMRKQFDNPQWKKQMEDMKKQSDDMRKQFNSPQWKKQMEDIQKQGDDMRKQFDKADWNMHMKGMKWKLTDSVGDVKIYKPVKKDSL